MRPASSESWGAKRYAQTGVAAKRSEIRTHTPYFSARRGAAIMGFGFYNHNRRCRNAGGRREGGGGRADRKTSDRVKALLENGELAEGKVPELVVHILERRLTEADAEALERLRQSLDDIGGERRSQRF
jgi:hypothetical protein